MQNAETKNDSELNRNADSYPKRAAVVPPKNAPIVSVIHPVVCVSEFAVCSSSSVAIEGRIADRPLVKNGEAMNNSALKR